jgi:hypothetical protein
MSDHHEFTERMRRKQRQAKATNLCPACGLCADRLPFKDEDSLAEYRISGLCQECQDFTFQLPEDV